MSPAKKALNITAIIGILTVCVGVVAAAMHAACGMSEVRANTEGRLEMKAQLAGIEENVSETHADVRVIRALMEKEHPPQ